MTINSTELQSILPSRKINSSILSKTTTELLGLTQRIRPKKQKRRKRRAENPGKKSKSYLVMTTLLNSISLRSNMTCSLKTQLDAETNTTTTELKITNKIYNTSNNVCSKNMVLKICSQSHPTTRKQVGV